MVVCNAGEQSRSQGRGRRLASVASLRILDCVNAACLASADAKSIAVGWSRSPRPTLARDDGEGDGDCPTLGVAIVFRDEVSEAGATRAAFLTGRVLPRQIRFSRVLAYRDICEAWPTWLTLGVCRSHW
jgi:hypothetical protein